MFNTKLASLWIECKLCWLWFDYFHDINMTTTSLFGLIFTIIIGWPL